MKYINIAEITNNLEEFILAKVEIDKYNLKNKKITEKPSIQEFINSLDMQTNMFVYNDIFIPFTIINIYSEQFMFYSPSGSYLTDKTNKAFNLLKNLLIKYNYNLSVLSKVTNMDIINDAIKDSPYFILNGEFYK